MLVKMHSFTHYVRLVFWLYKEKLENSSYRKEIPGFLYSVNASQLIAKTKMY